MQGGYIPTQDKQYLFAIVQLPEAATIDRTDAVMRRMGEIALDSARASKNVVQFPGLNAVHFVATPNAGVMFVGLEQPGERELEAGEIAMRINMGFGQIQEGLAFALLPPPVLGLGNANGLELYVEDRGGARLRRAVHATRRPSSARSGRRPGFDPMATFTSYQSNVPQLDASVDRTKVKELGLALTDVFSTLQVYLGSAYVNDFNLFGRTYQVYAQADAPYRASVAGHPGPQGAQRARRDGAARQRRRHQAELRAGPGDPLQRLPGRGHVGGPQSGGAVLDRRARRRSREVAEQVLPRGMAIEWTGLTYQQVTQGNTALFVFPLCVLLVYLVLAALYESWSLPLAIILIVPLCLLSAIGGIWLVNFIHGLWLAVSPPAFAPTFLDNNIFTKIGLAVLIGLACKNAILIVEFARDLEAAGPAASSRPRSRPAACGCARS